MEVEEIKSKAAPVLARYGATEAYLFGSAARGEATSESDIDILAKFTDLGGLFGYVKIKLALEEALGRRVDLVQMEALRPAFKASVDQQKIKIM